MRMIDQICQQYPEVASNLLTATKLKLQNVADLFFSDPDRIWPLDAFPSLISPWPIFFGEYRATGKSLGVEVECIDIRSDPWHLGAESPAAWILILRTMTLIQGYCVGATSVYALSARGQALEFDGESLQAKLEGVIPRESLAGRMTRIHWAIFPREFDIPKAERKQLGDQLVELQREAGFIPLMAISLCHCKNVAMREITENLGIPKSIRDGKELGPDNRWRVLDISSIQSALREAGAGEQTGSLRRAFHICRGHFANYRAERPLFGKFEGSFWRPMHVRGDPAAGTVSKDYSVTPPEDEDPNAE